MRKSKIIALIIISSISLSLFACGSNDSLSNLNNGKNSLELNPINAVKKNKETYDIKTVYFNLGEEKINKRSYYIRGIMSLPTNHNNEKLKPVLIAHGRHDDSNSKRYDKGFKYLTEHLAKNGYLAISMDHNAAYDDYKGGDNMEFDIVPKITNEHIENLQKANNGEDVYGIDLKGKIDFDNITLIGHSRGGQIIFKIAEEQSKKGVNIKSLLSLAPSKVNADIEFKNEVKNIAIVVPELDGDVSTLDGLGIYRYLREENKQDILTATLVKGANHNYFSTEISNNDAKNLGIDISNQLSAEEQQDFFKSFVVNYLDSLYSNDSTGTIFDVNSPTIDKINGYDTINYLNLSKSNKLIEVEDVESFIMENGTITKEVESPMYNKDTTIGVSIAEIGSNETNLLNVTWNKPKAELKFKPKTTDLSKFSNINMGVLIDCSSELNEKGKSSGFTVKMVDEKGKSSFVEVKNDKNIIQFPEGELEKSDLGGEIGTLYNWSRIMPISNVQIPLASFNNIDLSKIKEISIVFNENDKGSLYFESFYVN